MNAKTFEGGQELPWFTPKSALNAWLHKQLNILNGKHSNMTYI